MGHAMWLPTRSCGVLDDKVQGYLATGIGSDSGGEASGLLSRTRRYLARKHNNKTEQGA